MELRCESGILHGIVVDDDVIEVACKSRRCGKQPGVVVLHRFNVKTREIVATMKFKDPTSTKGVPSNGIGHCVPVRSA